MGTVTRWTPTFPRAAPAVEPATTAAHVVRRAHPDHSVARVAEAGRRRVVIGGVAGDEHDIVEHHDARLA